MTHKNRGTLSLKCILPLTLGMRSLLALIPLFELFRREHRRLRALNRWVPLGPDPCDTEAAVLGTCRRRCDMDRAPGGGGRTEHVAERPSDDPRTDRHRRDLPDAQPVWDGAAAVLAHASAHASTHASAHASAHEVSLQACRAMEGQGWRVGRRVRTECERRATPGCGRARRGARRVGSEVCVRRVAPARLGSS